jgi:hypothetical protein
VQEDLVVVADGKAWWRVAVGAAKVKFAMAGPIDLRKQACLGSEEGGGAARENPGTRDVETRRPENGRFTLPLSAGASATFDGEQSRWPPTGVGPGV